MHVFGDEALNQTMVFEWHPCSRQVIIHFKMTNILSISKTEANMDPIEKLIQEGHHLTIQEIADKVGIYYGVHKEILTRNLTIAAIYYKTNNP